MPENYASASEMVRNLSQVQIEYEVLETHGKFRIIRFGAPFWGGYEFWIVSDKGFLWEPAASIEKALEYLESDEALEYNR